MKYSVAMRGNRRARKTGKVTSRGLATHPSRELGWAAMHAGSSRLTAELQACLPTPWRRLRELECGTTEFWLKDDGYTGISYGGNKLRKLPPLLHAAKSSGKKRIVTVGAAGSHHVLATTLYGRRE
ncbi:MAG: hypothetical protein RJA70_2070, partial [Pseudomonadota bacterium]